MKAKAVIFDMDGLLLDTERVNLESFNETRREFSLSDDDDAYLGCIGLSGEESDRVLQSSLDATIDFDDFMKKWRTVRDMRLARDVPVKFGALRLIQYLSKKGVPMGVATSTDTNVARSLLRGAGLSNYLDCVVGKDLVKEHKPNPEVYNKVSGILGWTSAQCIAFEDSDVGTRAAIASGALTVQVPDLVPPSESLKRFGHIVASDLLEGAKQVGLIETTKI